MRALVNARLVHGRALTDGMAVLIADGRIRDVVPRGEVPAAAECDDLDGGTLAPGLIDVQVNGGGGRLFNDDPSVETITAIGAAHRRFGTTGFLPTLISDDLFVVRAGIAAVDAAIAAGVPGVLGIHIEGPFLNPERKGIHDPQRLRPLDDEGAEVISALRGGRTLVTLAPERTTPKMIRRLTDAGVIVMAGHTNATFAEMRVAIDAGLQGCTHLLNAMSPLRSREPGAVGALLDESRAWCGLIVDGQHVHPATMRVALHAKGLNRMFLVTDGMPSVGAQEKAFLLQGRTITVEGGACFASDGTLAGSDLNMAQAVGNAQTMLDIPLADALLMASRNPAALLGLDRELGALTPGARADLVLLGEDGTVRRTWIGGREPAH